MRVGNAASHSHAVLVCGGDRLHRFTVPGSPRSHCAAAPSFHWQGGRGELLAPAGDVDDGSEEDEVLTPVEPDSESVYGSTAQFGAGRETGGAGLQHERLDEAEDLYGTVEKAMPPLFH